MGYGNIGHYALEALLASPDMELAGVVRRNGAADKPAELANYEVVKSIKELKDVDVAILATPTRSVEEHAKECLALGINTVDSFDIHTQIVELRRSLDAAAKAGGCPLEERCEKRPLDDNAAGRRHPQPSGLR